MATSGHEHCIVPAASAAQRRQRSGDVLWTIQLEDLGQMQGPGVALGTGLEPVESS